MFYRYKVVQKKGRFRKIIVPLMLIAAIVYLGNRYKRHLQFWKYSSNKIIKQIEDTCRIKDTERRLEALQQIGENADIYKDRNQTDPEAFLISGKVHYLIGELYQPGTFSELIINDKAKNISTSARSEFIMVLKDLKKTVGYLHGGRISMEYSLILAKACFYTDYMSPAEIKKLILASGGPEEITSIEDIRFYSLLGVYGGEEEHSLKLLSASGKVGDSIQGTLFMATSEKIAKRYTNSIIHYNEALNATDDSGIRKLVHVNLGKIYYTQSLFRESLGQFTRAGDIDQKDAMIKIWIGKNYFAVGERDKAKAIWSEVLVADKSNIEAKKLLGVL